MTLKITELGLAASVMQNNQNDRKAATEALAKALAFQAKHDVDVLEEVCYIAAGQIIQGHVAAVRIQATMSPVEKQEYTDKCNKKGNASVAVLAQTVFDYLLFDGTRLGDALVGDLKAQYQVFATKVRGNAPEALWFKSLAAAMGKSKKDVHSFFQGNESKVMAIKASAGNTADKLLQNF